jgi:hypothetical protein
MTPTMKRLTTICAVLALLGGVAGCGGSTQTPEQKHSGLYNMNALAKNLEGGAEQSPGSGHVTATKCVATVKATAICEMALESSTDKKTETATITINPEGTHFVISRREESNTPKAESSESPSSSGTGGTWDEEDKSTFTRVSGEAGESEAKVQCKLSKFESHFSTGQAYLDSSTKEDVSIAEACEGL